MGKGGKGCKHSEQEGKDGSRGSGIQVNDDNPGMGCMFRGSHCGRGGHHWTDEKRHKFHSSFTSESSTDSDNECQRKRHKKFKKHFKKQMKCWHRMGGTVGMGHHLNSSITVCTLCCHRIKPFVSTDVLNCGHIYHRLCLKELFELSLKSDETQVFCSQCKTSIDENLSIRFKHLFQSIPTNDDNIGQQLVVDITGG